MEVNRRHKRREKSPKKNPSIQGVLWQIGKYILKSENLRMNF